MFAGLCFARVSPKLSPCSSPMGAYNTFIHQRSSNLCLAPVEADGLVGAQRVPHTGKLHAPWRHAPVAPCEHLPVHRHHQRVPLCSCHSLDILALQEKALLIPSEQVITLLQSKHSFNETPESLIKVVQCKRKRMVELRVVSTNLHGLHETGKGVCGRVRGSVAQLSQGVAAPGVHVSCRGHRHRVLVGSRHAHDGLLQRGHPASTWSSLNSAIMTCCLFLMVNHSTSGRASSSSSHGPRHVHVNANWRMPHLRGVGCVSTFG